MNESDDIPLQNATGDPIPGGGLARVTGVNTATGFCTVAKPNADSQTGLVVVGRVSIPAGGTGVGSFRGRVVLAFDPISGAPVTGDSIGSVSGSWYGSVGKTGFKCLGGSGTVWTNAIRLDVSPGVSGTGTVDHIATWAGTGTSAIKDSPATIVDGAFTDPGLGSGYRASLSITPVETPIASVHADAALYAYEGPVRRAGIQFGNTGPSGGDLSIWNFESQYGTGGFSVNTLSLINTTGTAFTIYTNLTVISNRPFGNGPITLAMSDFGAVRAEVLRVGITAYSVGLNENNYSGELTVATVSTSATGIMLLLPDTTGFVGVGDTAFYIRSKGAAGTNCRIVLIENDGTAFGVAHTGYTGTVSGGATAYGGIITAPGSGDINDARRNRAYGG